VVASIKKAETLSTVALALAVVTFVAQLIVFVVQAGAANRQMLQSRALHDEQLRLLGEMGERARGTDLTVTRIDERLLEVALGKTLGERDKTGVDAKSIAMEVAGLMNAAAPASPVGEADSIEPRVQILDPVLHQQAQERFAQFPGGELVATLDALKALSPEARAALVAWARDEMKYEGTTFATGLMMAGADRQEVLESGLVVLRAPDSPLYILNAAGRDAAAVLLATGNPPDSIADVIHSLRSNAEG
jgi:hypothetical protein